MYTYDDNGNITEVYDGTKKTRYVYDKENQLLREDNQAANKTWGWVYDAGGNITIHGIYAYTLEASATLQSTVSYGYGDSDWKDLLTSFNGQTITYDNIGNPLTDGTWTYTWEHGRELARMTSGNTTWNFIYDADGMRTSRSNGTTEYDYVYVDSQLVQMTVNNNTTLRITYDANGPLYVDYNGTIYYYVTNLQGDVIALVTTSGTPVVEYTYDAWGKILSTGGTLKNTLGEDNPLRYRGYIYDRELGLYYLQSRYYNPVMGRFINADSFPSTGQGLTGNNMFAYCNNSPVVMKDDTGSIPVVAIALTIAGGGVFGIISQFVGGITKNSIEGKTGIDLIINTGTMGDYTSAFLSGAFSAIPGVGTTASVVFDVAIAPAIQQGVDYMVGNQDQWNADKYYQDVLVNGASCAVTIIATTPVPQYIRDIKDEAQSIGLKGTKAYTQYLSTSIGTTKIANQFLAMSVSIAKEVYKGAARKMIPCVAIY